MTTEEVRNIMKNELRCVQTASTNSCDRDCGNCQLVMDTEKIVEAYRYVIEMLENNMKYADAFRMLILSTEGDAINNEITN